MYKVLGNLAKRSPTYFQDSVPLCDRYLRKGWYAAFDHKMPTTAPFLTACGTTYPYWLDGSCFTRLIKSNADYFHLVLLKALENTQELLINYLLILLNFLLFFFFSRYFAQNSRNEESSKGLRSWIR